MTRDEAAVIAAIVTGATSGWDDAATTLLIREVTSWDDEKAAFAAADAVAHGWVESYRPSLGFICETYERAAALNRERLALTARGVGRGCDGSGWIVLNRRSAGETDDTVPCRRCNPYLADIYDDVEKWRRYLDGVPLHLLHDDVEVRTIRGKEVMRGGHGTPPRCQIETHHDPAQRIATFLEGVEIARDAYIAECAQQGREPNWDYFESLMVSAMRSALNRVGE